MCDYFFVFPSPSDLFEFLAHLKEVFNRGMVIIMFILFTRKVNQRSWQRKFQFSHKNSLYLLTSQLPNFVKSLKTLHAVSFAIVNQNKIISELRGSLYSYEWTGVQTRCLFNVVNYINFIFYCFQPSSSTVSKLLSGIKITALVLLIISIRKNVLLHIPNSWLIKA